MQPRNRELWYRFTYTVEDTADKAYKRYAVRQPSNEAVAERMAHGT